MADNTTICVNGELKPGDLVISAPQNSYAGLVGTVLSINKAGTPEHDEETDNPGDDVHVDFAAFDYSNRRIGEIEDMFSDLYDEKKSFDECPIDDVIMAPDMLIRITGIGRDELAEILDSEEKAVAYCKRVIAEQSAARETPAQAALHEPDASDDNATAALREQLIKRLDKNMSAYFDNFQSLMERQMVDKSSEIAAYTGAHFYLTERHNFHTSELEYLLRFKDPLSVVADQFELESAIEDHSAVMWDIFDKQDALQGDYELIPEKTAPSLEERVAQLRGRLKDNYEVFKRDMLDSSKENLFYSAAEILPVQQAYEYFTQEHNFLESDAAFLLKFENPLELISDRWSDGRGVTETVDAVFKDQERTLRQGGYTLVAEEPAHMETKAPDKATVTIGEKPSVLARLREARSAPKEPRRDSPAKDRGGPEL